MSSAKFHYTGMPALEIMAEAERYNRFLEQELVAFAQGVSLMLDFGAGTGHFAFRLRQRGIHIDCIEPDAHQQTLLQQQGFTVHARLENLEKAAYQRIYSLNVLEHIEQDVEALRQLRRYLTPEGKLFLYVPAFPLLYNYFDAAVGHYRRYSRSDLVKKIDQAGFRIKRVEYVDALGFFAWLLMKCLRKKEHGLNLHTVLFYDQFCFPISRMLDHITKRFFGKNLLIIAENSSI